MFIVSIETEFFEHYLRFYREIQRKINFKKIMDNQREVIRSVMQSAGKFLVLQGGLGLIVILMAPHIFKFMDVSPLQISIFRYGVLGALFHAMFLFLTIVMSYFDSRKTVAFVYVLFMVLNGVLTYITMHMGFDHYGYGYFLASLITFVFAAIATARFANELPFHAFITSNDSVGKKQTTSVQKALKKSGVKKRQKKTNKSLRKAHGVAAKKKA